VLSGIVPVVYVGLTEIGGCSGDTRESATVESFGAGEGVSCFKQTGCCGQTSCRMEGRNEAKAGGGNKNGLGRGGVRSGSYIIIIRYDMICH